MASAHHTAFLLAILIGILLLLFVACLFFICYCRKKCFQMRHPERKRRMLSGRTKEQTTSMTGVDVNFLDPPGLSFYVPQTPQISPVFSWSLPKSVISQRVDHGTSCTTLENWATLQSKKGAVSQQARLSSGLPLVERQECEHICRDSTTYSLFSSCPTLMESSLRNDQEQECPQGEQTCSKRHNSSMNSQLDSALLQTPQESTIPDDTSLDGMRPTRQEGHCSVLSERSPLHCLWRSTTSILSRNSLLRISQQSRLADIPNQNRCTESEPVPGTPRASSMTAVNLEGNSLTGQSAVHLPKTRDLLSPKAWFIFLGNGPLTDSARSCKKNINNVTSLDSGVDILELQLRQEQNINKGCAGMLVPQQGTLEHSRTSEARCSFEVEELHCSGPIDNSDTKKMEEKEPGFEVQISHTEAVLKLNEVLYENKRSQWQKIEERPLMGIY
ncbi:protein FAM171A1-like [Lissotriton helveticus]